MCLARLILKKKIPVKIPQNESFKIFYFDFIFSPVFDDFQEISAVNIVSNDFTDRILSLKNWKKVSLNLKNLY